MTPPLISDDAPPHFTYYWVPCGQAFPEMARLVAQLGLQIALGLPVQMCATPEELKLPVDASRAVSFEVPLVRGQPVPSQQAEGNAALGKGKGMGKAATKAAVKAAAAGSGKRPGGRPPLFPDPAAGKGAAARRPPREGASPASAARELRIARLG